MNFLQVIMLLWREGVKNGYSMPFLVWP